MAEYLYSRYTITVENPRKIKGYAIAELQRSKTDTQDAKLIGEQATAVLLSTYKRHEFKNAKQFTAYLGLDPRKYQSGTSVNGKSRISKIGSSEIRKSLYMPAVVAYRCNAFPEFVGRLKNKGKHIKLILIAIMRKLAVIAFTLLKNGQDFQVERYK